MDAFSQLIRNNRDLYEACVRNGFYHPKLKCSMVAEEYMRQVIIGKAFFPKFKEIRMKPCPRPPNKNFLLGMLRDMCDTNEWR